MKVHCEARSPSKTNLGGKLTPADLRTFSPSLDYFEMGSASRYSRRNAGKRRFKGNQFTSLQKASRPKMKSLPSRRQPSNQTQTPDGLGNDSFGFDDNVEQKAAIADKDSTPGQTVISNVDGEQSATPKTTKSAASKKIKLPAGSEEIDHQQSRQEDSDGDFYFFMDSSKFLEILSAVACCPECNNKLTVRHLINQKYGLCHKFELKCICSWSTTTTTSKQVVPNTATPGSGRNPFDVNDRAIVAFREIGKGFSGMERFCGIMNMMPPMSKTTFNDKQSKIHDAYVSVCQNSMQDAAVENRKLLQEKFDSAAISDLDVSLDGTWQRRGYASLNGIVTAISHENGKCIDYEVLSKDCQACKVWERKKGENQVAYENFKTNHNCPINHVGSSGSMETKAAVAIFQRSVAINKLRYKTYIGDGDSSAYQTVVDSKPYKDLIPAKGECIGHVQKRVGTRLRKLKSTFRGRLSDGKTLGGRGRLTERLINTLQNAMGMAIRQNVGNLYGVKKSVGALLFHYSENQDLEKGSIFVPEMKIHGAGISLIKLLGKRHIRKL